MFYNCAASRKAARLPYHAARLPILKKFGKGLTTRSERLFKKSICFAFSFFFELKIRLLASPYLRV